MLAFSDTLSILREILQPLEVVETHISVVFLTSEYVYKVKKELSLGFLDFRTLEQRKKYSLLEKELNSRFCSGIYLEVLKLVRQKQRYRLLPLEAKPTALEYVLKMKRIPSTSFLSYQLKHDSLTQQQLHQLGEEIAILLKNLPSNLEDAKRWGNHDVICKNVQENFEQTKRFQHRFPYFSSMQQAMNRFLHQHKSLFQSRVEKHIKDGHGDLRLEHVFWHQGKWQMLDCIEFNHRFRFNDVVAEVGFLAMEFDKEGKVELSDALMKGFFKIYHDQASRSLLNFYKCYRAHVRAKVIGFLLEEKGKSWPNFHQKRKEFERLAQLASFYSLHLEKPKHIVLYGLMGTGKSTLASHLLKNFPLSYKNTDQLRKQRHHLAPDTKVYEEYGKGIYSKQHSLELYQDLANFVKRKDQLARATLLDGSFSDPRYWAFFSPSCHLVKVLLTAPEDAILARLKKRESEPSISDGRESIFAQQKRNACFVPADFTLNTAHPIQKNIESLIQFLFFSRCPPRMAGDERN
ncbi:MAG: gluconate kinase [Planctomycetota bacterium]|nr:MAG: gluconate kinase [Planctomycetota bacterium]